MAKNLIINAEFGSGSTEFVKRLVGKNGHSNAVREEIPGVKNLVDNAVAKANKFKEIKPKVVELERRFAEAEKNLKLFEAKTFKNGDESFNRYLKMQKEILNKPDAELDEFQKLTKTVWENQHQRALLAYNIRTNQNPAQNKEYKETMDQLFEENKQMIEELIDKVVTKGKVKTYQEDTIKKVKDDMVCGSTWGGWYFDAGSVDRVVERLRRSEEWTNQYKKVDELKKELNKLVNRKTVSFEEIDSKL